MMSIAEFFLLSMSLGRLNYWDVNNNRDSSYSQVNLENKNDFEPEIGSKSLYDLMVHFPTDKGVICPESDSRLRYPGECTRYVTCRDFQAYVRSCPPGMSFDEDYGHCRLSFEVNCTRSEASCAADEEYTECGCEISCRDLDVYDACDMQCETGCLCRQGLVRNEEGHCVEPDTCDNSIHSIVNSNFEDYL